jgi:hypothetical protein
MFHGWLDGLKVVPQHAGPELSASHPTGNTGSPPRVSACSPGVGPLTTSSNSCAASVVVTLAAHHPSPLPFPYDNRIESRHATPTTPFGPGIDSQRQCHCRPPPSSSCPAASWEAAGCSAAERASPRRLPPPPPRPPPAAAAPFRLPTVGPSRSTRATRRPTRPRRPSLARLPTTARTWLPTSTWPVPRTMRRLTAPSSVLFARSTWWVMVGEKAWHEPAANPPSPP